MTKEIRILITLQSKFVSVNDLYRAKISYFAGHPRAVVYKNPKAVQVESEVRCQLLAVDFNEYLGWLKTTDQFELDLKFILKKNGTHRDSSNMIKALEDIWTRFVRDDLGVSNYDDSMHIKVTASKSVIPGASSEYAVLTLRESRANIRYDIEPKPIKIWVSGWSLDQITAFLPPLPKRLLKKETYQVAAEYDKADTKVYILQPDTLTQLDPTLIPTIYKDVIEAVYNNFGFVYVGVIGGKEEWKETEWKQIEWLMNEAKGDYKGVRVEIIEKQEDLLEWIQ